MDNTKHRRLQELDSSDFEIAKGEPDIRGWDVKNDAGLKIGEVEELIVDAQQKKVRYMVVDLGDKDLKLPDRKVLIPIGLAELHKEDDDVLLPAVTVDQLSVLPAYDKDNLDDDVEQKVCTVLGRTAETTSSIAQTKKLTSGTSTALPENKTTQTESKATDTANAQLPASDTSASTEQKQPALGSAEYYGNFYQHTYFNDYNLHKNRQQQRPTQAKEDSEYESGLRLWELRNEDNARSGESSGDEKRNRDLSENRRKELIQNRRKEYEEQRAKKKGSTIIQRINEECLQEE